MIVRATTLLFLLLAAPVLAQTDGTGLFPPAAHRLAPGAVLLPGPPAPDEHLLPHSHPVAHGGIRLVTDRSETQRWEGTSWGPPVDRWTYAYDDEGHLSEMLNEVREGEGEGWRWSQRYFAETSGGRLTVSGYETWVPAESRWVRTTQFTRAYGESGLVAVLTTQRWNADGSARTHLWFREWSTYDAEGRRTEHLTERWDAAAGSWAPWLRDLTHYDGAGRLLGTERFERGASGDWTRTQRTEVVEWNAAGLPTLRNSYTPANALDPNQRTLWAYDDDGRETRHTTQRRALRDAGWVWEDVSWHGREYSSAGLLVRFEMQAVQVSTGAVWYHYRWDYSHGEGGLPVEEIFSEWDPGAERFENVSRTTTTYRVLSVSAEEAGGALSFALDAYPNPAADRATVRLALPEAGPVRLAAYDLLGRQAVVLADGVLPAGAHTFPLDAAGLAAGMYVLRVEAGGQALARRLTVLR